MRNPLVKVPLIWVDAVTEWYEKGPSKLKLVVPVDEFPYTAKNIVEPLKALFPKGIPLHLKRGPLSAQGDASPAGPSFQQGIRVRIQEGLGKKARSTIRHELRHAVQYMGDFALKSSGQTKRGAFGRPTKEMKHAIRAFKKAAYAKKAGWKVTYTASASEFQTLTGTVADGVVDWLLAEHGPTPTPDQVAKAVQYAEKKNWIMQAFAEGPAIKEAKRNLRREVARRLQEEADIAAGKLKRGSLKQYGLSGFHTAPVSPTKGGKMTAPTAKAAKAKAAKAKATSGAIKLPPLSGWKKQTYSPMGEGASWVKYTWGNLLIMDSEDLKVFGAEVAQEYDGQLGWYDYEEVAESGSVSPYKKGSAGEARKLLQAWVNANPDKVVPGSTKAKKPEQVFAVYGSKGGPKLGTVPVGGSGKKAMPKGTKIWLKVTGGAPKDFGNATYQGQDSKGRAKYEIIPKTGAIVLLLAKHLKEKAKAGQKIMGGGTLYVIRLAVPGKTETTYWKAKG